MQTEPTPPQFITGNEDFGPAKRKSYLYEHMLNYYWDARADMEGVIDMLRLTDMISDSQYRVLITLMDEIAKSVRDVAGAQAALVSRLEDEQCESDL